MMRPTSLRGRLEIAMERSKPLVALCLNCEESITLDVPWPPTYGVDDGPVEATMPEEWHADFLQGLRESLESWTCPHCHTKALRVQN
jgi:Zn finger protein HypA/HybF involved in hydrogenase expression